MHFVDEALIRVEAGNGGDGAVAFRREKFVPFGGPAGGDGGRGGSVVFVVDAGLNTLYEFRHQRTLRAKRGNNGEGRDMNGAAGKDLEVRVPPGTIVYDQDTGQQITELTDVGDRWVAAEGGGGGRGNRHFATPTDRAPKRAEPGQPGQARSLRLELKVMADVGLLGFPNVGKSTFIRAVSRARPKVAEYPFTTLIPHLGVVTVGDSPRGLGETFVIADIPGLIPGASGGAGLGIQFLKHVERTRVLLHLVTLADGEDREPVRDYQCLRRELESFSPELAARPEIVALSQADRPEVRQQFAALREEFEKLGVPLRLVSAVTRDGLGELCEELARTQHSAEE